MRSVGRRLLAVGFLFGMEAFRATAAPPAVSLDPFQGIHKGDRVRVILRTRAEFVGVARAVAKDSVTLDMGLEQKGTDATMAIPAGRVLKVEMLKPLEDKEVEQRWADRRRRQKEAEESASRIAERRRKEDEERGKQTGKEAGGAKPAEGEGGKAGPGGLSPEDFKKGMELLKEFPPKDGWGTAEDKTIEWLRTKFTVVRIALTPPEQRFVDNYDLWLKMKTLAEKPPEPSGKSEAPAAPPKEDAPPAGAPAPPGSTPAPAAPPGPAPGAEGPPSAPAVPTPALAGTAYDMQKLLVRGSVTLVDFGAEW